MNSLAVKKGSGLLAEFRQFAMRGNVIDMAVGIIIGGAFTTVIRSAVDDIMMPPLGALVKNVDFADLYILLVPGNPAPPYYSLAEANAAGAVTLNYGRFINNIVSFLIVALATFLMVRTINRLKSEHEKEVPLPTTKACPYCHSTIPLEAVRCPMCTSYLSSEASDVPTPAANPG